MQFNELNLTQELLNAVEELGFTDMTEIQEKSIPVLLEGKDVIGRSNTGTGKTAAFGIPAIENINKENSKSVNVLILCPTRELAMQACEELKKFARFKRYVKPVAVYGGASMERQIMDLKRGANIVVGTPGRVMDHIRRRTLKLENLKTIILDEADEMLNMGFREDIETILTDVPEERQTVLFSATMPPAILAITKTYQTDPVMIKIDAKYKTVDLIDQYYFEVAMGRKTDALKLLIAAYSPKSSMIFCNTKKMVDDLTEELLSAGFKAAGLHGDMKQGQRTQVMNSFKNGSVSVLIATDVAARGIDVSGIDAVFNYDLPQDNEYYIHRIGRTGRAGRKGVAYTLVSGRRQVYTLKDISRFTKAEIKELPLPQKDDIIDMKVQSFVNEISELEINVSDNAKKVVALLAEKGIDANAIAEKLIAERLQQEINALPEFDMPRPLKQSRRKDSKNTAKIEISIGRNRRIAPNFILGALVDATGLSGKDFGKIDIFEKYTTVEIPTAESSHIIESMNETKINGNKVQVKIYEHKFKPNTNTRRSDGKVENKGSYNRNRSRDGKKDDRYNGKRKYNDKKENAEGFIDTKQRTKKRH